MYPFYRLIALAAGASLSLLLPLCVGGEIIQIPRFTRDQLKCQGTQYYIENICEREEQLLNLVKSDLGNESIETLTQEDFRTLSEKHGMNYAHAAFYLKLLEDPKNERLHRFIIERTAELKRRTPKSFAKVSENYSLLFVPGMFYDNSNIDSDGELIRRTAAAMGIDARLLKLAPGGTVKKNGGDICKAIQASEPGKKIILASLSKGGSDVVAAFHQCAGDPAMDRVIGWFNIGGTVRGTPLVEEYTSSCNDYSQARFFFLFGGYDWDALEGIRRPQPFSAAQIPSHVTLVNIHGIALDWQVTFRGYPYYERLKPYGPNDGLTLLRESYVENSFNYGAWRNDHYFRYLRDAETIQAFLYFIIEEHEK